MENESERQPYSIKNLDSEAQNCTCTIRYTRVQKQQGPH
jgi:hypothetical protein